jgi:hypothetical protein
VEGGKADLYCAPRTGHKMGLGELEWTDVQNTFGNPKTATSTALRGFRFGVTSSSVSTQRNLTGSSISSSPSLGMRPQTPQESHSPTPSESAFACTRPPRTDEGCSLTPAPSMRHFASIVSPRGVEYGVLGGRDSPGSAGTPPATDRSAAPPAGPGSLAHPPSSSASPIA